MHFGGIFEEHIQITMTEPFKDASLYMLLLLTAALRNDIFLSLTFCF